MVEIVELHPNTRMDVPAMLRNLADRIEDGDLTDVHTAFAVVPVDGDFPMVFGWGRDIAQAECGWTLQLALHWLRENIVRRV